MTTVISGWKFSWWAVYALQYAQVFWCGCLITEIQIISIWQLTKEKVLRQPQNIRKWWTWKLQNLMILERDLYLMRQNTLKFKFIFFIAQLIWVVGPIFDESSVGEWWQFFLFIICRNFCFLFFLFWHIWTLNLIFISKGRFSITNI